MIHVHLSPSEHKHFADLYQGAGWFKIDPNLDAKGKRERTLMALDSVLFKEKNLRQIVGEHDVTVHLVHVNAGGRFMKVGA